MLFGIIGGGLFCFITFSSGDRKPAHFVLCFVFGFMTAAYLLYLAKIAKSPSPWLRRHIGLITKIGGAIVAATILWSIIDKK